MEIGDHVTRIDSEGPVGLVEAIEGDIATVRWGTIDNRTWRDDIQKKQLSTVKQKILDPEEVQLRDLNKVNAVHRNVFDQDAEKSKSKNS